MAVQEVRCAGEACRAGLGGCIAIGGWSCGDLAVGNRLFLLKGFWDVAFFVLGCA